MSIWKNYGPTAVMYLVLLWWHVQHVHWLISVCVYVCVSELSMGWVNPQVGLGWDFYIFVGLDWVEVGRGSEKEQAQKLKKYIHWIRRHWWPWVWLGCGLGWVLGPNFQYDVVHVGWVGLVIWWVGSKKLDPRTTLVYVYISVCLGWRA